METLLAERPLDQLRAVQSLIRLGEKVGSERLEAACRRALFFGDPHYRRIKAILGAGLEGEPLPPVPAVLGRTGTPEETGKGKGDLGKGEPGKIGKAASTSRSYQFARGIQEFFPPELFESSFSEGEGVPSPKGTLSC